MAAIYLLGFCDLINRADLCQGRVTAKVMECSLTYTRDDISLWLRVSQLAQVRFGAGPQQLSQNSALTRLSPVGLSPVGLSPVRLSPVRLSPVRLSPVRLSPVGLSPVGLSPVGLSPVRLSPVRLSQVGLSPVRLSPVGLSPVRLSPVGCHHSGCHMLCFIIRKNKYIPNMNHYYSVLYIHLNVKGRHSR